jgi:hypothetical protein
MLLDGSFTRGALASGATDRPRSRRTVMLTLAMIVLGLATFAAMLGFVALCDRV